MAQNNDASATAPGARARRAAALFLLSLSLNVLGIGWGQPGGIVWDFDSIAGLSSVKEMPHLLGRWRHKYPRVQFAINALAYAPLLKLWYGSYDAVPRAERRILASPAHARRFGALIVVSRTISALMGAGAVVALFLAGSLLFGDARAGLLAGLSLAVSQMFVFYSHLGNLDAPAVFWFAWSFYWAVQALAGGRPAATSRCWGFWPRWRWRRRTP